MATLTWEDVHVFENKERAFSATRYRKDRRLVRIPGIANPFEAALLSGALEDEHIPHAIEEHHETAHAGIFVPSRAWGSLVVPHECGELALEILNELRAMVEAEAQESDEEE